MSDDGVTVITAREAVNLDEFSRLNVLDSGKGKFAPGEASAAVELQNYLGGKLERITATGKNADFVFASGANQGKTVDFMFTPDTLKQADLTNKFFEKNLVRNEATLIAHLGKADIVPMDFRFLTERNQQVFMDVIQRLPKQQQSQIIVIR